MGTSLSNNFEALFSKLESFVTTKTVVGEPIHFEGVIIVPLIEVSIGVGAGSADGGEEKKGKEAAGGALGAKITPSAVVAVINDTVQLVNVKNQDSVNKLIDMVPGILSKLKLNLSSKKNKDDDTAADPAEE